MKKYIELASILDGVYQRLIEINRTSFSRHLPDDLTIGDVRILRAVSHVGSSGVTSVAVFAGKSQPAATMVIARLEKRGLVERAGLPSDGRLKTFKLTPKGVEIEQAHTSADADTAEMILNAVPKNKRDTFIEIFSKLAINPQSRSMVELPIR